MRLNRIIAIAAAGVITAGGLFITGQASAGTATIHWHGCVIGAGDQLGSALDEAGAQCGEVTVPVSYADPRGPATTVAMARIKATDPKRRRGVLMLDPGGPGTSGMELTLINTRMPAVAARYDLIGMDPRFVGRSSPLTCDWSTDTFLRSAGPDRTTFDRSVTLMKTLAAGCVRGNKALLPYATTRNTARDMDRIRQALGEPKLNYLGYSYGTYLGAVYLQMFGAHADRVVLDSAVDPDVYGPGLLARNGPAIQAALEHWATWAAAHDGEYGLGATRAAVLSTIDRIHGPLRDVLPLFLFGSLYDDSDAGRVQLAEALRVFTGATPTPTPALRQFLDGFRTGSGAATDRAGTPVLCADRAVSRDPGVYYRDIQAHRATEPLFGPLTRNITPCSFWPVRGEEAPTTIRNGAPALIVGATGDPAAPYPGQQAMHRALAGSRMLTLRGGFGHGQYLAAGNNCVDDTVNRYLTGGPLPAHDGECSA